MQKDKQEVVLSIGIGMSSNKLIRRGAASHLAGHGTGTNGALKQYANVRTLASKKAVVPNGYLPEPDVLTAAGPVAVKGQMYVTTPEQA